MCVTEFWGMLGSSFRSKETGISGIPLYKLPVQQPIFTFTTTAAAIYLSSLLLVLLYTSPHYYKYYCAFLSSYFIRSLPTPAIDVDELLMESEMCSLIESEMCSLMEILTEGEGWIMYALQVLGFEGWYSNLLWINACAMLQARNCAVLSKLVTAPCDN
jgi:hypothetical protein